MEPAHAELVQNNQARSVVNLRGKPVQNPLEVSGRCGMGARHFRPVSDLFQTQAGGPLRNNFRTKHMTQKVNPTG
jgi:hypothetical protein